MAETPVSDKIISKDVMLQYEKETMRTQSKLTSMNKAMMCMVTLLLLFLVMENIHAKQPIEIGLVDWNRDYEESLLLSKSEKKPIFLLFQEVPGCSGCKNFGKKVLSNKTIVQAIESEFIPLVIFNNRPGKDESILDKYNEPSWNFQVIRFLNSEGKDIIPRKEKIWSLGHVARRMVSALQAYKKEVSNYLLGISLTEDNPNIREAVFSMYCFWTGEVRLGKMRGVTKTESGFYLGQEVTRVWFDPTILPLQSLILSASKMDCAHSVYLANESDLSMIQNIKNFPLEVSQFKKRKYKRAPRSDQKKQINKTIFMKLRLSDYQLTKVNALARTDIKEALTYLTPDQLKKYHKRK